MAGQQVIIRLNNRHPALKKLDPRTSFLYAPHTLSVLLLGLALLAYHGGLLGARVHVPAADGVQAASHSNAAAGLWAAVLVFLGYSVVHGPTTSMIRPHPAVWRLVHGAAVVYVLMLVWLLFQTVDDARQVLRHLSPSLGVEIEYKDYGTGCLLVNPATGRVAWLNIRSTLWDEFVPAHILGWWAKALLIRNTTLLWMYSVGFELLELTFAHMLPNFNECWWDSWLLDVAICNSLGIALGMATVRWLDCKYTNYNWQGISELSGLKQRARRGLAQLLPYSWSKLDWMVFSSPQRCLQSMVVVAAFLTVEVNVFFLKYALWIPPANWLNVARLVLWLLVGAPAVREYYEFIQGDTDSQAVALAGGVVYYKLGAFAWIAVAMSALETMICIKFGRGLYPRPWPKAVLASWSAAAAGFAIILMSWQLRIWQQRSELQKGMYKPTEQGLHHAQGPKQKQR